MTHFVKGHRHHVVHAFRHLTVQAEVPLRVFCKLHHHVWGGGVQILSCQLVGQGHRVLAVLKGRALKVVHHLIGGGLGQHVGWERIPNGFHLNGDHRLDGLGPNVHSHFHGGLGVVGEHGAKFQVDDRTAGPRFRREPVRHIHLGVAIHTCALKAGTTEVVACSAVLVGCVKRLQALRTADVLAPTQLREQQAEGEKIPAHHGGQSLLSNINIRYKFYTNRRMGGFFRGIAVCSSFEHCSYLGRHAKQIGRKPQGAS